MAPRCRSSMATLLLRLRAAAVKYIEFIFLARYPIWRDRAGAAHCTLYTDKLDHLPDIGQHGAHPFLTTPPRDHVRHAIHKSKTARSSWHDRSVVITRSAAMAMQLRWRLMPSRSPVSAPPSFS